MRFESLTSQPTIDAQGWLVAAPYEFERVVSPNEDARPDGMAPALIVVHGISLPPGVFGGRAIDALFTNTLARDLHPSYEGIVDLRVSSHFLIRRRGDVTQFVACGRRAWHAGVSSFEGRDRCNDFSIGIELEGDDATPYEAIQYDRLASLVGALSERYAIEAIAGHADVAPGRKTDPGPHFDWPRLLVSLTRPLRMPAPRAL